MPTAEHWLRKYGGGEAPATPLRTICVPVIVIGVVGLFWSLPVPDAFRASSPAVNWGTLFLSAALVYYFVVSIPLAFGALPFIATVVAAVIWLDTLRTPLWLTCAALFGVAWTAQWLAVQREPSTRSALRNLQFLMLGPLWLVARLYRRLGIPY